MNVSKTSAESDQHPAPGKPHKSRIKAAGVSPPPPSPRHVLPASGTQTMQPLLKGLPYTCGYLYIHYIPIHTINMAYNT